MTLLQIKELEAQLQRRDARIAELEAELEAVGAGGVNGPLMGGYSAADMAAQGAEQFRAGQASMQAGEPVGYIITNKLVAGDRAIVFPDEAGRSPKMFPRTPLYTPPQPDAQAVEAALAGTAPVSQEVAELPYEPPCAKTATLSTLPTKAEWFAVENALTNAAETGNAAGH